MGVLSNVGVNLPEINPVNWGSVGIIIASVIVLIVGGGVTFFIVLNNINKKKYIHKITFAKEINGKIFLIGEDFAKELTIPYTSIKVFYLRKGGTWSPKLIYDIGKNHYLILIGKGGEWINTDLRYGTDGVIELNDELKPTRDYANENLKELIKRNWTDKNADWWKKNAHYVFLIALGIIIIIALVIAMSGMKKTSANLSLASNSYLKASEVYAQANNDLIKVIEKKFSNSGIIQSET
jgi:hypothetical protein